MKRALLLKGMLGWCVAALLFGGLSALGEVPLQRIDLQPLREDGPAEVSVGIVNPTAEALRLEKVDKDCGCVQKVELGDQQMVEAGKVTPVTATLALKDRTRVHATLACSWKNASGEPVVTRSVLSGTIAPAFTVEVPDERTIFVAGEKGVIHAEVELSGTEVPSVQASIGTATLSNHGDGKFSVCVDNLPTGKMGFFDGKLVVTVGQLVKERKFAWGVRDPLVQESKVVIGIVKATEQTDVSVTLKAESGTVESVQTETPGVKINGFQVEAGSGASQVRIQMSITTKGTIDSCLVVKWKGSGSTRDVVIPFSALVI